MKQKLPRWYGITVWDLRPLLSCCWGYSLGLFLSSFWQSGPGGPDRWFRSASRLRRCSGCCSGRFPANRPSSRACWMREGKVLERVCWMDWVDCSKVRSDSLISLWHWEAKRLWHDFVDLQRPTVAHLEPPNQCGPSQGAKVWSKSTCQPRSWHK